MAISNSQLGCNDIQANYELENGYTEFFEKCDYVMSDNQIVINKKGKMIYSGALQYSKPSKTY